MTNIRGIVFDWGGVIIDEPTAGLQNYCTKKLGIDAEQGGAAIWKYLGRYQEKRLSERQMWEKVCHACGQSLDAIPTDSLWSEALRAVFTFRNDVVTAILSLKQNGYKTGFLSNTEPEAAAFFHEKNMDDWFDGAVLSCEVGISKPQPAIYRMTAQRLQLPVGDLLFFDDRPENIAGARDVGMVAAQVTTGQDVLQVLQSMGIL